MRGDLSIKTKKTKGIVHNLTFIQKCGITGSIIGLFVLILYLLKMEYNVSWLSASVELLLIPIAPLLILGVMACGWFSFNPEGAALYKTFFCQSTIFQVIFYALISIVIWYFIGKLIGHLIIFFRWLFSK